MKKLVVEHDAYVLLPRKTMEDKKVSLSLNVVFNMHYHERNNAKKVVKENVQRYLEETNQSHIKFDKPVHATFKMYKPTRRKTDKSNFSAGGCKFIYDALVELGHLVDDNDDWIKTELLEETVHDRDNPRIVLTFTEVEE